MNYLVGVSRRLKLKFFLVSFLMTSILLSPQLVLPTRSPMGQPLAPGVTHLIGQINVASLPILESAQQNGPVISRPIAYPDPAGLARDKAQAAQPDFVPPGETSKVIASPSFSSVLTPRPITSNLILDGAPNDGGNTCSCTPPDPDVGVGPNHVFEIVNVAGIIYQKNGALAKATFSLSGFFNLPVSSMADPQILYDGGSGRWFASVGDGHDGRVQIAASTDSDPTGTWNLYYVSTASTTILPDHPWLGASDDKLVILAYLFNPGFLETQYWVLNKAELVAGAATIDLSTGVADTAYASVHPARHLGSSMGLAYMIEAAFGTTNVARLFTIAGVPPGPITVTTNSFAINTLSNPPNGVQPDPSPVFTNDDHIVSAVWEANTLWFAAIDACIPNGDTVTRSCLRLIQLTTVGTAAPTKVQDFDYASAGQYLFYPALSLSGGSLVVVYGLSSSTIFPSLLVTGRLANDPLNTLQAPFTIKQGSVPNNNNRYGDYFGAATDPTQSPTSTFWVAGEYRMATATQGWSTAIAEIPAIDDGLTLNPGEASILSSVIDPTGGFAYFGGWATAPGLVVKVRLSDLTHNATLDLGSNENGLSTAVIDTTAGFAYFGSAQAPGAIVKIRLSNFTRVGSLILNSGENFVFSSVIDPLAGFGYFGTGTSPGIIVKVRLSDFTRVATLTLNAGDDLTGIPTPAVIDPVAGFAYFGTHSSPATIVKIRLSDFTRVGSLTLNTGENALVSAVIDPAAGFAYFGTNTAPGIIVKVRLSDFTRVGAITLPLPHSNLVSASVIDPVGGFGYFATSNANPDNVWKIRLSDFTPAGNFAFGLNEYSLQTGVIDPNGGFAYFATATSPGIVVKVSLFDYSLSSPVSVVDIQGSLGSGTFTVTLTSGTAQAVFLSCTSPLPAGASCAFSPLYVTTTGSSILTVSTKPATPTGSFRVAVTTTGGGVTHATSFLLDILTGGCCGAGGGLRT